MLGPDVVMKKTDFENDIYAKFSAQPCWSIVSTAVPNRACAGQRGFGASMHRKAHQESRGAGSAHAPKAMQSAAMHRAHAGLHAGERDGRRLQAAHPAIHCINTRIQAALGIQHSGAQG
eukprot:363384-Chlamydomonas_euryale.AAC.12